MNRARILLVTGLVSVFLSTAASVAAPEPRLEVAPPSTVIVTVRPSTTTTAASTTTVAPTTTTTTLPSGDWRCAGWLPLALEVGWPVDQLGKLDVVMYRESRCNVDSWNRADPMTGSYGLMQVNGYWCSSTKYNPNGWLQDRLPMTTCADLFDPTINLAAGLLIWQRSGWSPWSTA